MTGVGGWLGRWRVRRAQQRPQHTQEVAARRQVLQERQQVNRERQDRLWGGSVGPERLLAFSDGVFAIAITLLSLEIRVEPVLDSGELLEALGRLIPDLAAYALSFSLSACCGLATIASSASSPAWTGG